MSQRYPILSPLGTFLLGVAWALIIAPLAWGQPSTKLETVLDSWKAREKRVDSVRITWSQRTLITKGLFEEVAKAKRSSSKKPSSDRLTEQRHTLLLDRRRMIHRYEEKGSQDKSLIHVSTYDGTRSKRLKSGGNDPPYPFGVVGREDHNFDIVMTELFPLLWHFRPFDHRGGQLKEPLLSLHPLTGNVDGRTIPVIEYRGFRGSYKAHFWVDPTRDYSVLRYILFEADKTKSQIDIVSGLTPEGEWVPKSWDHKRLGTGGVLHISITSTVTDVVLNPPTRDADFRLDFPEGAVVTDMTTRPGGESYLVRADGSRRIITPAEYKATYDQWLGTESGMALRLGRGGYVKWFVLANILAIVLAGGFLVWLRIRKYRADRTRGTF